MKHVLNPRAGSAAEEIVPVVAVAVAAVGLVAVVVVVTASAVENAVSPAGRPKVDYRLSGSRPTGLLLFRFGPSYGLGTTILGSRSALKPLLGTMDNVSVVVRCVLVLVQHGEHFYVPVCFCATPNHGPRVEQGSSN